MEAIDAIKEYLDTTNDEYEGVDRYSDGLLEFLQKLRCHSVSPSEFEQFRMDIQTHQEGAKVVINTDEIEVSAFFKILIDNGAKVEVYSAHDYPDEKDG
jgi:predicted metal-dependent hydrolase